MHYTFDSSDLINDTILQDKSGNGYDGVLKNEAYVMYDSEIEMGILDLGSANGYLDMLAQTGSLISELDNFTIAAYVNVGSGAQLNSNGNFLWCFANSDDTNGNQDGNMFYHVRGDARYAITADYYPNEVGANTQTTFSDEGLDMWHHVVVTQVDGLCTVYFDGIEKGTSAVGDNTFRFGCYNI